MVPVMIVDKSQMHFVDTEVFDVEVIVNNMDLIVTAYGQSCIKYHRKNPANEYSCHYSG